MVAYALYKQSKRDWIRRLFDRDGNPPDDNKVKDFVDHFSEADLQRFREQAEDMMIAFAEVIVENRTPDIYDRMLETHMSASISSIASKIDVRHGDVLAAVATNGGLWRNVQANIYANLIIAGLTLVLFLSVYLVPNIPAITEKIWAYISG